MGQIKTGPPKNPDVYPADHYGRQMGWTRLFGHQSGSVDMYVSPWLLIGRFVIFGVIQHLAVNKPVALMADHFEIPDTAPE